MTTTISFDPDPRITPPLREIFLHWSQHPPSSQYRQYGVLDKYFNLKFPLDMIKPQNELREHVDDEEVSELFGDDDITELNPDDVKETVKDESDLGNVSVDSIGKLAFTRRPSGKKYPDLVVSSYYGASSSGKGLAAQKPRLVIEVGSLDRNLAEPSPKERGNVLKQLLGYLHALDLQPTKWKEAPVGIAVIGTKAAFLYPVHNHKISELEWHLRGGANKGAGAWYSIYNEGSEASMWTQVIDRIAKKSTEEALKFGRHGKVPR